MKTLFDIMPPRITRKKNAGGKICSKCGKFKALKYFYRSSSSKDGHRNECKECSSKIQSEGRKRKRDNNDYTIVAEKTCCECGRMLPISMFAKDYTKTDNHKSYCKECMSEQQKHRNRVRVVKTSTGKL